MGRIVYCVWLTPCDDKVRLVDNPALTSGGGAPGCCIFHSYPPRPHEDTAGSRWGLRPPILLPFGADVARGVLSADLPATGVPSGCGAALRPTQRAAHPARSSGPLPTPPPKAARSARPKPSPGVLVLPKPSLRLSALVARTSPPSRDAPGACECFPANSFCSEVPLALEQRLGRCGPLRSLISSNSWCQNSCMRPSSSCTSRARYSGLPHLPLIVPVSPHHSERHPDSPTLTLVPITASSEVIRTSSGPPPLSCAGLYASLGVGPSGATS